MNSKMQSDNRMPVVTNELRMRLICFNETEVTVPAQEEGGETRTAYQYDFCRVPRSADRSEIIDAVVRSRYTQSEMEAVVNNYLREDKTEEQTQAFTTMQAWRVKAKEVADEVLEALA